MTAQIATEPPGSEREVASLRRFLGPSLIGAVAFLLPVHHDGAWTILLGIVSEALAAKIGPAMPALLLTILTASALLSLLAALVPGAARIAARSPLLEVFNVRPLWALPRLLGATVGWMVVFAVGPEFIWSELTGRVALLSLAAEIVTIFFCAAFLLPMLTDYGLMEFVGTVLRRPFRTLFTLPGRAAVDALASWLSSAAVGVLITVSQYEKGFYTRREALVIATNFSVTSLPFCLFIVAFLGLEQLFFPVYATVITIGVCCAILLPRLPPLRGLHDQRRGDRPEPPSDAAPADDGPLLEVALTAARRRAALGPDPRRYALTALQHVLDIWMGLLPLVVLIGTAGLAIAEFTPLLRVVAAPIAPLLSLLGLPEAAAAAPTFIVGFFDMFLPAALGQSIDSEYTRFVIAAVSLTQLIYLSEVGALLLRSALDVRVLFLLGVFLLRTLIGLPIALVAARLVLGGP
jgi:nucleoside recognition membrane protein YjiH